MAAAQRHGVGRLDLADAGDLCRLVAVKDRAILRNGDLARRGRHRIEVGIAGAAVYRVQFAAAHLEGDAQFDQRLDAAQPCLHLVGRRRRCNRIGTAKLDIGSAPAQRPLEVDDAPRRQKRMQGALRFLLDLFPAGFGNGSAIT